MNTFIRAAEVWLPSADRSLLEFGGGAYAAVPYFGAVSRSLCFGRGEGLPGRAWEEGHPIVLQRFDGTYFLRIVAAHEAGLTCAIAVPTFHGGELSAVLVLFCGDRSRQAGAIELWRNDPRVASDMTLVDGYYGAASDALQAVSRDTSLPRGTGLPGLAWQRTESVLNDARTACVAAGFGHSDRRRRCHHRPKVPKATCHREWQLLAPSAAKARR